MTIAAATPTWRRMVARRPRLDVAVVGISVAAVKVGMEQLAGQAAWQVGNAVVTLHSWLPSDQGRLTDWIFGALAVFASVVNGWTSGLAGTALTLVLPVGGPVWAGVIPLGATLTGVRMGYRWVGGMSASTVRQIRLASVALAGARSIESGWRVPATGNAPWRAVSDDGQVSIRILVVDDSSPFRELARRLLIRDGFEVVGTASTCAEAISRVSALRPQVALVDINLGADSGFEVARRLGESDEGAGTLVVLMSTRSEDEYADLIAESPAAGFVAKERLSGHAIRFALAGRGL